MSINKRDFFVLSFVIIILLSYAFISTKPVLQHRIYLNAISFLTARSIECSDGSPVWMKKSLKEVIQQQLSMGNQLAYISPEGQLFHCESGWKGQNFKSDKIEASDRFKLASLTKLVTADMILSLVKEGQLSLDDKMIDLLHLDADRFIDKRIATINVLQLLTHRAGFDRSISGDRMFTSELLKTCPAQMEKLYQAKLDFDPGAYSAYSNLGYCLLGEILKQKKGTSYMQAAREEFDLASKGMEFIEDRKTAFPDEIIYDFFFSGLYNYMSEYNYIELASSAGLTGNASSFARLVYSMAHKPEPNILSASPWNVDDSRCNEIVNFSGDCYELVTRKFSKKNENFNVHITEGYLPGVTTLAIVDQYGGVTTLFSNNNPPDFNKAMTSIRLFIYDSLYGFYNKKRSESAKDK